MARALWRHGWAFKSSHMCDAWSSLVTAKTWRKHPMPYAKTRAGKLRRATRQFVVNDKMGFART